MSKVFDQSKSGLPDLKFEEPKGKTNEDINHELDLIIDLGKGKEENAYKHKSASEIFVMKENTKKQEEELQADLPEPDIAVPEMASAAPPEMAPVATRAPPGELEEMLEWLVLNHAQE